MITITNNTKYKFNNTDIKKYINFVLEKENIKGNVNVFFVNEYKIKQLNKKFLNRNIPTDILSFPMDNIIDSKFTNNTLLNVLGDIVICPKYALSQKESSFELLYKKTLKNKNDEIYFLLIHGILHLSGYEHSNNMFKKQYLYFKNIKNKLTDRQNKL